MAAIVSEPAVGAGGDARARPGTGGNFTATPLSEAGQWTAGGSDGAFTYSYPISVPAVPGGLEPSVSLDYDSQSVDGLTSSTNDQASWVGDGWDYAPGLRRAGLRLMRDRAAGRHQLEGSQRRRLLVLERHRRPCRSTGSTPRSCRTRAPARGTRRRTTGRRSPYHTGTSNGTSDGGYWVITDHRRHLLLLRPERAARLRLRRRGDQQHLDRAGLRDLIGAGVLQRDVRELPLRAGVAVEPGLRHRPARRRRRLLLQPPRPTTTPRTTAPPPTAPSPRAGRRRRSSTGCGPGPCTAPPRPPRSTSTPAPSRPTSRPTSPAPTARRATSTRRRSGRNYVLDPITTDALEGSPLTRSTPGRWVTPTRHRRRRRPVAVAVHDHPHREDGTAVSLPRLPSPGRPCPTGS